MVFGSHANTRAIYSTPPCPSLAASTAAYRRRSFSDSHPKNRCIFCSISAEYPSMPHSLIQNLLRGQDTTAQVIREVILDHILGRLPYRETPRVTRATGHVCAQHPTTAHPPRPQGLSSGGSPFQHAPHPLPKSLTSWGSSLGDEVPSSDQR